MIRKILYLLVGVVVGLAIAYSALITPSIIMSSLEEVFWVILIWIFFLPGFIGGLLVSKPYMKLLHCLLIGFLCGFLISLSGYIYININTHIDGTFWYVFGWVHIVTGALGGLASYFVAKKHLKISG